MKMMAIEFNKLRRKFRIRISSAACWISAFALLAIVSPDANAQHRRHSAELVPGAVGREQVAMRSSLRTYFQAVEIVGPKGSKISLMADGALNSQKKSRIKVGMLIGEVYRCKVTEIPKKLGAEVFPTIEVINRLYPPDGLQTKYPIPIVLTQEDLELALKGSFITRVVYLEDPRSAFPAEQADDDQLTYDVNSLQDPLAAADKLGRPMAIIRIGSRIPNQNESTGMGTPAVQEYEEKVQPAKGTSAVKVPGKAILLQKLPELRALRDDFIPARVPQNKIEKR